MFPSIRRWSVYSLNSFDLGLQNCSSNSRNQLVRNIKYVDLPIFKLVAFSPDLIAIGTR